MPGCNKALIKNKCLCTYCDENGKECIHKGKCCVCIAHHRKKNELPACYFTPEQEKTYNRSIDNFVKLNHKCSCKVNTELLDKAEEIIDSAEIKF